MAQNLGFIGVISFIGVIRILNIYNKFATIMMKIWLFKSIIE